MDLVRINKTTFQFLRALSRNNQRDWFNDHKDEYINSYENLIEFVDSLILEMNNHDELENESGKKSLFRIYKDVRFSKDKAPYNPRFAFSFQRATKYKRGGYYANIKPGGTFIACGFFGPNPEDLRRIRLDIAANYRQWNKLLKSKWIARNFGELSGEKLNTKPNGYSIDHPAIELLRYKQFIFRHDFSDQQVLSTDFIYEVSRIYKSVRPFFDYMSEVLTTNSNGELVV
jgi:uncharacterized protein (TIGR02453 family)